MISILLEEERAFGADADESGVVQNRTSFSTGFSQLSAPDFLQGVLALKSCVSCPVWLVRRAYQITCEFALGAQRLLLL